MKKSVRRRLDKESFRAMKVENPDIFSLCSDSDVDEADDILIYSDSSDDKDEMETYSRSVDESDGFNVVLPKHRILYDGIVPVHIHQSSRLKAECEVMAEFAIEKHNEKEKTNLEFVEVKKANMEMVGGTMFYLTILVKDKEVGRDLICEAKVWRRIEQDKVLKLFRIKMVDEGK